MPDIAPRRTLYHDAALRDGGPADFSLVNGDQPSDPTALWRVWRVSWSADPDFV